MKVKSINSLVFWLIIICYNSSFGQNGSFDEISDLFSVERKFITTPDGAKLSTDLYLPITSDSLVLNINIPGIGSGNVELIKKGIQYIYYPELDSMPNPNPYELPTIMTRTAYGQDRMSILGYVFALLGSSVVLQDTRGAHNSNDLWMPLYADGWDKTPYSNFIPYEIMPDGYQNNPSTYEDGQATLDFVLDDWVRDYDIDDDGIVDFQGKVSNGNLLYFGASALANTGLLMALTEPTDRTGRGLKGFLNIIATSEHFSGTLFENGLFNQGLVREWISLELDNYAIDSNNLDTTWLNTNHTFSDFGFYDLDETVNAVLDLLTIKKFAGSTLYYPYNEMRSAFDASRAYVDANGESDPTGAFSRYRNFDMPGYHVTGWWDIFNNSQIKTWQNIKENLDPNSINVQRQKLIIGPWQHFFPASRAAGDLVWPENVGDVLGFSALLEGDIFEIIESILDNNAQEFFESELFSFISSTMNYNEHKSTGPPQIRFPKNEEYQQLLGNFLIQIPSEDYILTHADLVNWIGGQRGLEVFPAEIHLKILNDTIPLGNLDLTIPPLPDFITDIFGGFDNELSEFPVYKDFATIPDVRLYICGPMPDGVPENRNMGNYWIESDEFPITSGINYNKLFLHKDGKVSSSSPNSSVDSTSYEHNPMEPVATIGGHNLTLKTPDGRNNMGPLNLANELWDTMTLNRPGVIHFETQPFDDSVQVVGYIKADLYAASMPENASLGDPTDTDFIIRLLDVYPNGKEYLISEGNVNARAREYVRSIYDGQENDFADFSNIASGKVYHYQFDFLPTGYTFGKKHKLKLIISSSNYPRHQSNPNVPLNDDEYFRWEPGFNRTYEFNGQTYAPRKATNTIYHNAKYPSHVLLPLRGRSISVCSAPDSLIVEVLSDSSVLLNWDGASGASEYQVSYRPLGTGSWTTVNIQNNTLTLNGLQSGIDYEWQVESLCNDTTSEVSRIDSFLLELPTAINDFLAAENSIYPNPVVDNAVLNLPLDYLIKDVQVFNLAGQFVTSFTDYKGLNNQIKIDFSDLSAGEYFVKVRFFNKRSIRYKFIKQ